MDLGITGRIALISGADSGMGKETARLLLEAGVRVAVTDKPGGTLDDAVRELSPLGEIVAVTGDVTKPEDVAALWAEVRGRLGEPDIYVNSAGVTGATVDFLEIDDKGWHETIDIDLPPGRTLAITLGAAAGVFGKRHCTAIIGVPVREVVSTR